METYLNTRPNFMNDYPIIFKLIRLALIILFSNAYIKRVFFYHKLIKTKLRNWINYDTLNMHLMIFLNSSDNFHSFN